MKVIIAGSRSIDDYEFVKKSIEEAGFKITEVVSGRAKGVDRLGEAYARENNIPVKQFRVDWNTYGRSAGIKRNIQMGDYADALIAVWDGTSKGTEHMIKYANYKGLRVFVKINNDVYYKNFEKRFGDLMEFLNKQSWKLPKITAKDVVGCNIMDRKPD